MYARRSITFDGMMVGEEINSPTYLSLLVFDVVCGECGERCALYTSAMDCTAKPTNVR